tara:strand:- start:874 stop:1119 length:246 start_codon:yes stop_codon:yes gene_type:complete
MLHTTQQFASINQLSKGVMMHAQTHQVHIMETSVLGTKFLTCVHVIVLVEVKKKTGVVLEGVHVIRQIAEVVKTHLMVYIV